MKKKGSINAGNLFLMLGAIVLFAIPFYYRQYKEQQKGKPADPCKYSSAMHPATVLRIQEKNRENFEVFFLVPTEENRNDTITYSSQFSSYASQDQLNRKKIIPGAVFTWQHMKLDSGSCEPEIGVLILEPFK
jgi:hypothetical protein